MQILLDCSPDKIADYRERYQYDFGQLRTPLTQYALASAPVAWAADNGFFKKRQAAKWLRWVGAFAELRRPMFVTMPDIVGDAMRTIELFHYFKRQIHNLPLALVLQNGIEHTTIPWDEIDTVFIGGDDQFKYSPEAFAAAKTAIVLGKHLHVGRVNTAARVKNWLELAAECDENGIRITCDGSGMSRFDHMLDDVLYAITGKHPQTELLSRCD